MHFVVLSAYSTHMCKHTSSVLLWVCVLQGVVRRSEYRCVRSVASHRVLSLKCIDADAAKTDASFVDLRPARMIMVIAMMA